MHAKGLSWFLVLLAALALVIAAASTPNITRASAGSPPTSGRHSDLAKTDGPVSSLNRYPPTQSGKPERTGNPPERTSGADGSTLTPSGAPLELAATPAACTQVVQDGSFEGGTPNASWTEFSLIFGTPICDVPSCGTGEGTSLPRTGDWWAWFGGSEGRFEQGSLRQNITLQVGTAALTFFLWIGDTHGDGSDYLKARIDGKEVFSTLEGNPAYSAGYTLVTVSLTPYADGGNHALEFESTTYGPGNTNFTVDDVAVESCPPGIGDYVWYDTNADGVQGATEFGLGGVTLALWSDKDGRPGTELTTTTTDVNGKYLFGGLMPGSYFVQVTDHSGVLTGLGLTTGPQSKPNLFGPITVAQNQTYADADFGYALFPGAGQAVISNAVWNDTNGNGIWDPGEPGIAGVQVCAQPLAHTATYCGVSNAHGIYGVLVQAPVTYLVAPRNLPAGMTATTPGFVLPLAVRPGGVHFATFGYK